MFAKGAVWYSESGTRPNTIVRFDPNTEKFQTWMIRSGGYIVRKMDATPDGNPVIATSTVNGSAWSRSSDRKKSTEGRFLQG